MPAPNLPNTLLKLGLALAKHHIKNVIGDEALEMAASTLTDVGGEKVQAKVDSIFASKEGQKELLKAAKSADERFKEKCKDNDLRELFAMDYGNLPSVQEAIAELPEALDDEVLRKTLFTAFRNDAPKRISDEKISAGVGLYVECLQSALLPVEDFGQRIIHSALKEIGKDVKDIKADVRVLLEKTTANSQDATASQKSYVRFLVPFPHNPDFVGRDAELSSLHEMLQQGKSIVGIRPTVLVGLGGIGKTQLAVEYAHAHRDDYPNGVFWLNAINHLLVEFSDLAEKLEMADRDTPRDKAARKAWDYLDSLPDALVIFDNVIEPSVLNVPFSPDLIPANLRCRTLFTTRQRDFPRTFQPFEVKILPEMAAMKLLLRSRLEVLEEHHPEWGWARIVCAELGWLPLALELAAAYLGAYPEVSITGYLERLRTEGSLETVDESEVRAVDLPTRVEEILKAAAAGNLEIKHQVAVSATLQTQWKRLDDEDAKLLFHAAGQFPEASWIPISRLSLLTGIESEAKPGRPSPMHIALKKLHAISLIEELSEDRLRLHPLVQEFAARLSPDSFRMKMAERVAEELNDIMSLQARVINYGVDTAIEDLRTGLGFCIEKPESETYSHISKMERLLDRQTHGLRNWNVQEQPAFFVQQIYQMRNESFAQEWQAQAEAELTRSKKAYLLEPSPARFHEAELRTLTGHTSFVHNVALSADGKLAVSASSDMTLKVWDVPTGRELRTLTGHTDQVKGVALSADGRLAVSASSDMTLKVWDVPTGRELRTLTGHGEGVNSVALSADGRLAVSASSDKTLKVWDVPTGRELRTLSGHSEGVDGIAMSADGQLAVSASSDKALKVWEVSTGRELRTLTGHSERVKSVALSADGRLAISASHDKTLKVWEVSTGRELRTLIGENYYIDDVSLSADGQLAVSVSYMTLQVWDLQTGRELHKFTGHSNFIRGVALSADGQLAVSTSYDQTLKVWAISSTPSLSEVDGFLQAWGDGQEFPAFTGHNGPVNSIAMNVYGRLAVSASGDKTLQVWEVSTRRKLRTLTGHSKSVACVGLSADGRLAVSASDDKILKVWNIQTGRELQTLSAQYENVTGAALSADGRLALCASYVEIDKSKNMWAVNTYDVETGRELRTLTGQSVNMKKGVALSIDGRLAIYSSSAETHNIWDVETARELCTLTQPLGSFGIIALSPDGQLAVSCGLDLNYKNIIRVWDVKLERELHRLTGHGDFINDVTLSADGRFAVSVSDDNTLKVWGIKSGHCIATLLVGAGLYSCAISADGKTIVAGDSSGRVHFLELVGADEI